MTPEQIARARRVVAVVREVWGHDCLIHREPGGWAEDREPFLVDYYARELGGDDHADRMIRWLRDEKARHCRSHQELLKASREHEPPQKRPEAKPRSLLGFPQVKK